MDSFSISKHVAWKEYYQCNPTFLSDMKDSSLRYMSARKRFTLFEDLVDFHPFVLFLYAKALFWLRDYDGCLININNLQYRVLDFEQLRPKQFQTQSKTLERRKKELMMNISSLIT